MRERDDVHPQQVELGLQLRFRKRSVDPVARVVDEHVDPYGGLLQRLGDRPRRVGRPQVCPHRPRADPVSRRQLGAEPVQLLHAARHQDKVVAVVGEEPRQLEPDPARGAGDEGGPGRHSAPPFMADTRSRASRLCRVGRNCEEYTCRTRPALSIT